MCMAIASRYCLCLPAWLTPCCLYFLVAPAGPSAPSAPQPAAFKPSANSMLFGHLPAAQPRSLAQGKLLSKPNPGATHSRQPQQQAQSAGRPGMQGTGAARTGTGWGQSSRPSGNSSSSSSVNLPKAGLPGTVPWQCFVGGQQQAAGLPAETPLHSQHQEPVDGGCEQGEQFQQQQATKQARAAWQGPAGAFSIKRSSTAAAFAAGNLSSSSLHLAGAGANWGSPWQGHDPFEELPAAPLPAAAAFSPAPIAEAAAAVSEEAPVLAAQSDVNTAAGQMDVEDGLDIGDIFAFMK